MPGFALTRLLKIEKNLLVNGFAFSYVIFFLVFWVCCIFQIVETAMAISMAFIVLFSSVYLLTQINKGLLKSIQAVDCFCVFGLLGVLVAYHAIVGAASDLPADVYTHMERFQLVKQDLLTDSPNPALQTIGLPLLQSYLWYYFVAMVASFTSVSSSAVLESTSVVSVTVFLVSVYGFASNVFKQHPQVWLVSVLTCVFLALHFGVNVFAFIRYYSLGPAMIGYCLYYAAIALLLDFIRKQSLVGLIKSSLIFVVLLIVSASNHRQEALFMLVMTQVLIFVYAATLLIWSENGQLGVTNRTVWCFSLGVMLIGLFAVYSYAHLNLERNPNAHWRLWEFGSGWGLIPDITTLNLKKHFIEVITLWGCLVYILFFLNLRRYLNNLFLLAGMLCPLFTILNPIFVDLFLRFEETDVIWRLCYIIPIHFVAADLFVFYFKKLKSAFVIPKLISTAVISLLCILLLPIVNTWNNAHFSRFPNLSKTPMQTSYLYYSDVIDFLDSQKKNTIVTDVITGYWVAAMTKHESPRRKFFRDYRFNHFSFTTYDESTLRKYKGHLLLINMRPQVNSELGRLSGHWSERELLNIDQYYPASLLNHIEANPHLYSELWSSAGVSIFQIN